MKQQLNFKTYSGFETKGLETTEATKDGEGVIYIEGYASKSYDMGKPVIDYDFEHVDIKGFDLSTCTSLLFNHNGDEIKVGKCRLEHRADGAYLYGEVHEKLNDKVYYAVKHGIMTDFSIGFSATNYEYKTIDGKDVLTFTEGFVWETSICNIRAANPKSKIETTKKLRQDKKMLELAKWLGDAPSEVQLDSYTEVKSVIQDGKCVGFSCDIEQLKKANPTQDCSCITKEGNKLKDIKEVMKGLTFGETEQNTWNQYEKLEYYMEILEQTISDNFFETLWQEGITGEEAKVNIVNALQAFTARLTEFTAFNTKEESNAPKEAEDGVDTEVEKTKGKKDMKVKSVETTESVETAPVTEEVILEGEEQASNPEQVEDKAPEQISTETKEEATQADVAVAPTEVVEEVEAEASSKLNVEYLASVNLEELSDDEVEELYNEASYLIDDLMKDDKVRLLASASDILEKIDALIESSAN
jgi:HK97 family phage prohead protease